MRKFHFHFVDDVATAFINFPCLRDALSLAREARKVAGQLLNSHYTTEVPFIAIKNRIASLSTPYVSP